MTIATKEKHLTIYPVYADSYFLSKEIIIRGIPDGILEVLETKKLETKIKSASQYNDYLVEEIAFWKNNDPQNILEQYTRYNNLNYALNDFRQALSYYSSGPSYLSSANNQMQQSINRIVGGHLSSKSKLAKFLIRNIDKGKSFIEGFMASLSQNRNQSIPTSINGVEGFITGLEYSKKIKNLLASSADDINNFIDNFQEASENYANLNASYTDSFHKQEERISTFTIQVEEKLSNINAESEKYFAERERRCSELESLYEEKLKLQAPANYWKELGRDYKGAGWLWLIFSVLFAGTIIFGLIHTLKYLPYLFAEDAHWIDIFKNSAIITVITSIAVYILRLFVKMAISSFHLSRDATERNKLTYFYLSLIEKKAVTEKERAIILNSLFSRSDTGLLKGDSSPTMSGNVVDLVNGFNPK